MPSGRAPFYAQMAEDTANILSRDYRQWMAFLDAVGRLYKYSYNDQLLIFAQKPHATACAEYGLWNQIMHRYIRKGTKGIGLLVPSGAGNSVRYVFDVSDTGTRHNSIAPNLWKMNDENRDAIGRMLQTIYGEESTDMMRCLDRIGEQLALDFWNEHRRDVIDSVDNTRLSAYDEHEIGVAFRQAVATSVSYTLQSRCDLHPEEIYNQDDFSIILNWNTPKAIQSVGIAVSELSEQVLRQIEITIRSAERSAQHDRTEVQSSRGLPAAGHGTDRGGADPGGEIRSTETAIPKEQQTNPYQSAGSERESDGTPARGRSGSESAAREHDERSPETAGISEEPGSDGLGESDEQSESSSRGDDLLGADLRLIRPEEDSEQISFLMTESDQIQLIDTLQAESAQQAPFAFSLDQGIVDSFLIHGSNTDEHRMLITLDYMKQKPLESIAEHLAKIYHGGNGFTINGAPFSAWYDEQGITIARGDNARYNHFAQHITWEDAAKRIGELLENGQFVASLELAQIPAFERNQVAKNLWFMYSDMEKEAQQMLPAMASCLNGGFPDETARLAAMLADPDFANRMTAELRLAADAYQNDPSIMRFRLYSPKRLVAVMDDLRLPMRSYTSWLPDHPTPVGFITKDEIDASLASGNMVSGGKARIYRYFSSKHSKHENADFLKKEYGIGAITYAVSGASNSQQEHSSKGLSLSKRHCPIVKMTWTQVASRIDDLIRRDRYLSDAEKKQLIPEQEEPIKLKEVVIDLTPRNEEPEKSAVQLVQTDEPSDEQQARDAAYEKLQPIVLERVFADQAVRNAIANSDVENINIEVVTTVSNVLNTVKDPVLLKYVLDDDDFVEQLFQDAIKRADELMSVTKLAEHQETAQDSATLNAPDSPNVADDSDAPDTPDDSDAPDTPDTPDTADDSDTLDAPDAPVTRQPIDIQAAAEEIEPINHAERVTPPYLVVTYHHLENGFDEKLDYATLEEAETAARGYVDGTMEPDGFRYDGAAIYDQQEKKYLRVYGDFPDSKAVEQVSATLSEQVAVQTDEGSENALEETPYQVGDTLYLDGQPFIVEDVDLFDIYLSDPSTNNPIFRVESRENLERILARNTLPEETVQPVPNETPNVGNFHITDNRLGEGGVKTKYHANVEAIRTLKAIEQGDMALTPESQEVLSRYIGWGGLPQAFDPDNPQWADEFTELEALLTPKEYEAARASTLNAHYTSPVVIRAMYDAIAQMGFKTGNILEPSMGVGNFFGLLPEDMQQSRLYGVEIDSITGRIAQKLYPDAHIEVTGFEKTDRKDFFDLAVGNVPFGRYKLSDKKYDRYNFLIHDYFFAKTIEQVRPGGVIAFITSQGTLDKKSPEVRRYIAQRAELLGAIRLPNNAFKANAGTEVTSDIIFLQKREHPVEQDADWVHLSQTADGIPINSYYAEHPEMVLGKMVWDDSMYGNRQETECVPIEGADLSEQLAEAVRRIGGRYYEAELPELSEEVTEQKSLPADPNVRNYSYTVIDGEVYYRTNSVMNIAELNSVAKERVKGMIQLRDCVRELIRIQVENGSDDDLRTQQERLNDLYDRYTARYGLISSRGNANAFSQDSSYYLLCSLEEVNERGELKRKADLFTKRTIRHHEAVEHVDTAVEALAVSIAEKAKVDLPYMAQLAGKSEEELIEALTSAIYPVPAADGSAPDFSAYVTADAYLSGNVRVKLREAQAAAKVNPIYERNVRALEAALPKDLDASEIDVRLGATWVDAHYIEDFMYEIFQTPIYLQRYINVQFSSFSAEWNITGKSTVSGRDVAAYVTYGTERASAYRILEDTLNLRDIRIYDTIEDADGKEKRVLNQKATTLAQQKQQAIKEAFRDWVWRDPDRRERLTRRYNELFNSTRPREYDGSHIAFGTMNPEINLREHQRNAVARILYGGNTLLAHQVGAGKTFEMVAACMESKRLGLSQKSLFVVPNHLTEQWAAEFLRLYPSANILVATRKDFEKANRRKFCARIATGDYDAVIIGHSQFERIPVSMERQERLLNEQIEEIAEGIMELKRNRGEAFSIKQMERSKRMLETRLRKLQATEKKDDVITFEELGIDQLFVDEAHAYKNLMLTTKMRNVAGLSQTESQKSMDMYLKCRYMDDLTGGRGIVFATGTPVSNSMTELYTMQRYLQYNTLSRNNLTHFDAWASVFGETTTAIELAPEGTGYRARTRFAKFFNLPELMTLFKEVADIKTADQLHLPTPNAHYETVVVQPSEEQKEMVQALSERAAAVHSGIVDPSQDNMLKITSDGRKLGLDQRLINPILPDNPDSKVNACVRNVYRIWDEGQEQKLTQLVFCDLSTPRGTNTPVKEDNDEKSVQDVSEICEGEFNVYSDIRNKLVNMGIPKAQIAFIHEANTEAKKKELFAKVRNGDVRVLLGSTQKMGAGTNVQDHLIALHDLDCPWRPGDLEQRAGRIVRQGNLNPDVFIYRYVTEATFDAYLWQTVENKQKFISQVMSSKSPVRACDDVDETALSYAEIKALCAGDPRIKEKMDLDVDVARLRLMRADHQSKRFRLEDQLLKFFPQQIEQDQQYIAGYEKDMETLAAHPLPKEDFVGMEVHGKMIGDKEEAGKAILEACKKATTKGNSTEFGSYRGFSLRVEYDSFTNHFYLFMRGAMAHKMEVGSDPRGNLIRMENALALIPSKTEEVRTHLETMRFQMAAAKEEISKPFPQEEEFQQKSARLSELDTILNVEDQVQTPPEQDESNERVSIHQQLREPCQPGSQQHTCEPYRMAR